MSAAISCLTTLAEQGYSIILSASVWELIVISLGISIIVCGIGFLISMIKFIRSVDDD